MLTRLRDNLSRLENGYKCDVIVSKVKQNKENDANSSK